MEEDGVITVTATVAQGKAIPDVEAALDAELARVRDEPVTAADLGRHAAPGSPRADRRREKLDRDRGAPWGAS